MYDYEQNHLALLRPGLAECAVLLKSNGRFPLSAPCPLAAYGSGVRHTVKGGTGSGEVNSRFFVNIEEGLRAAGFTLTTDAWLDGYDRVLGQAHKDFVRQLKRQARRQMSLSVLYAMGKIMPEPEYDLPLTAEGDAAIYVLSRICGEGSDRQPIKGDILLTDTEVRDILALNRQFSKFMLVLNTGGPVDLSPVMEVENILLLSQLGVETGPALADLLLGKQSPSGKLTTTWAGWEDYPALGDFGSHNDTCYREGIYVGYRYFDTVRKRPLFPFGHGLSYTEFQWQAGTAYAEGSRVHVPVTVRNTGPFSGKQTMQLYVSCPAGALDQPFQALAAFEKTPFLAPGESARLTLCFPMELLASYSTRQAAYLLEQGAYVLRLGTSSAQTQPVAAVQLPETITVHRVRNFCKTPDFACWQPEKQTEAPLPDLPVIPLDSRSFTTETTDYGRQFPVSEEAKKLTDDQLVQLHIGKHKKGLLSVIGNASETVAGAAGEANTQPPIVMADGPAGVRLSPKFYRDKKGLHPVENFSFPQTVMDMFPRFLRGLVARIAGGGKPPKKARLQYQYCTALPIGTALAQSWNRDFARLCGQIAGFEMAKFGVHLWLAPGMNLHRDIRCGRNFEYFSEDPLLTGTVAAAITQGVQSHPGRGVTLKHYAANNQETNRFGNSSNVPERALRELYLKAFAICIRQAKPKAVMSSYNLLWGVHTAEHTALCRDVLRLEMGFDGILMTDWVVGGGMLNSKKDIYPAVQPGGVAAAGGELFMPGSAADCRRLRKALKAGTVTRRQLEENATRLLNMANSLHHP